MAARTAADGQWARRSAQTVADGVGAREWLEMGGEKKPLLMSKLGCADGCGRQLWVQKCADVRTGCKGVAGNGWAEEAAGDERAWLRGWLRTGNAWIFGEVRGRLRTAADGVGATEWLEMGGEKKPLVMSELGCADGCGRAMGAENCADGCGRRGCNGVAGNGWGEEAAGDERAWLRGRLRTGRVRRSARGCGRRDAAEWLEMAGRRRLRNSTAMGMGELRGRLRTAWVPGRVWLEMGGEKKPL